METQTEEETSVAAEPTLSPEAVMEDITPETTTTSEVYTVPITTSNGVTEEEYQEKKRREQEEHKRDETEASTATENPLEPAKESSSEETATTTESPTSNDTSDSAPEEQAAPIEVDEEYPQAPVRAPKRKYDNCLFFEACFEFEYPRVKRISPNERPQHSETATWETPSPNETAT